MRFPSILAGAFLSFASLANGQDFYERPYGSNPDHLVPPWHNQDVEGYWGYNGLLFKHLLGPYGCGQMGSMLAMPAFTGEYCVSIYEEEGERDKASVYTATAGRCSQNLYVWIQEKNEGKKVNEIEVQHNSRTVSREFAVAYQRVWARAVLGTRYPSQVPYSTSDGISFLFSTGFGSQTIYGETSNPEKGFCADLVDVGFRIFKFVMQDDPKYEDTEADLIRDLKALEKQLDDASKS